MFVGQLALTMAAVFTGAAIYINIAEQPCAPSTRRSLSPRRVEAGLQAGLHDLGKPCRRRRGPRSRRLFQHPRLALAAGSRGPARKLALHDLRDHADQPPLDEHTGGGRRGRNASHDQAVGYSPCRAECSWPRGNSDPSVGSAL